MNRWANDPPVPGQKRDDLKRFNGYGWYRAALVAGTGITITHNYATGTITIGGGSSVVYIPFGSEVANGQTYAP